MNKYQVIVSNVGTVFDGNSYAHAQAAYDQYKADSINVIGKAAGEDVTLMEGGEPMTEYVGVLHREDDTHAGADTPTDTPTADDCKCPLCTLRRTITRIVGERAQVVEIDTNETDMIDYLSSNLVANLQRLDGIEVESPDVLKAAIIAAIVNNTNGG